MDDEQQNEKLENINDDTTTRAPRVVTFTNATGSYSYNEVRPPKLINGVIVYDGEDTAIGLLFASKALVQLFINPFSGAMIDRIGYDKPMMFGLTIMFFSTAIFSVAKSYGVLFFARVRTRLVRHQQQQRNRLQISLITAGEPIIIG